MSAHVAIVEKGGAGIPSRLKLKFRSAQEIVFVVKEEGEELSTNTSQLILYFKGFQCLGKF